MSWANAEERLKHFKYLLCLLIYSRETWCLTKNQLWEFIIIGLSISNYLFEPDVIIEL